jgi:hypothetical protein
MEGWGEGVGRGFDGTGQKQAGRLLPWPHRTPVGGFSYNYQKQNSDLIFVQTFRSQRHQKGENFYPKISLSMSKEPAAWIEVGGVARIYFWVVKKKFEKFAAFIGEIDRVAV